jgi:hypothetical protein
METELEPRKLQAIYMLIAGETHTLIAKTVGVNPRTVRRWMEEPEFSAQLKREYDSLSNIIRTHHRVQMLKSGEMSLEALRILHHVMTAEGSALTARMRAAGQIMNYSFKQIVHAQKMDKEEWATPIKGLHESTVEHETKREIKQAEKARAVSANAQTDPQQPAPAEPVAKKEPQMGSIDQLATVSREDLIRTFIKTDNTGQKRTSPAEHLARLERIQRLEEQLEAQPTSPSSTKVA